MKNNMCLNCRDCLHFKACYEMAAANEAEDFNTLFANTCEDFTDRSEWVHLPIAMTDLELVKEFEMSERGNNGFGSSGR